MIHTVKPREIVSKFLSSRKAYGKDGAGTGKLIGLKGSHYCCDECGSAFAPGQLEELLRLFWLETHGEESKR